MDRGEHPDAHCRLSDVCCADDSTAVSRLDIGAQLPHKGNHRWQARDRALAGAWLREGYCGDKKVRQEIAQAGDAAVDYAVKKFGPLVP